MNNKINFDFSGNNSEKQYDSSMSDKCFLDTVLNFIGNNICSNNCTINKYHNHLDFTYNHRTLFINNEAESVPYFKIKDLSNEEYYFSIIKYLQEYKSSFQNDSFVSSNYICFNDNGKKYYYYYKKDSIEIHDFEHGLYIISGCIFKDDFKKLVLNFIKDFDNG